MSIERANEVGPRSQSKLWWACGVRHPNAAGGTVSGASGVRR